MFCPQPFLLIITLNNIQYTSIAPTGLAHSLLIWCGIQKNQNELIRLMEYPFRFGDQNFPNHFNLYPHCGSKLVIVYNRKSLHIEAETYEKSKNKREHKKRLNSVIPNLNSLIKGD